MSFCNAWPQVLDPSDWVRSRSNQTLQTFKDSAHHRDRPAPLAIDISLGIVGRTSTHPSIEQLRELIKRDQEFFKTQSRLTEIQNSAPEDLGHADKNTLQNWDKSVVRDCNRQLVQLEELENPSVEERQIMQELNKLITLGDHIIERRNLVQDELSAKLAAFDMAETPSVKSDHEARETPGNQEAPQPGTAERLHRKALSQRQRRPLILPLSTKSDMQRLSKTPTLGAARTMSRSTRRSCTAFSKSTPTPCWPK